MSKTEEYLINEHPLLYQYLSDDKVILHRACLALEGYANIQNKDLRKSLDDLWEESMGEDI